METATTSTFEERKKEGNACIKEKQYQEAIKWYSSALELIPEEHTVFSNRSLAYLKVGRYEDALSDAQKCIQICPTFARGFMREAVALNMLGRYEEAKKASVSGYLLRGSDNISKECISQWLIATRKLFDNFYKSGGLPTGTVILSESYFVILLSTLRTRQSSSSGMSADQMKSLLGDVVTELNTVLAIFGHTSSDLVKNWMEALCHYSFQIDPHTSTLPKSIFMAVIEKSEALAKWINHDIDSILYPIVRPLLILAVIVVLSYTYVLNCMNLGHITIQVLSQACLVLFEKSILNTAEYLGHHIGTIVGLLDSFVGRGFALLAEDLEIMRRYCSLTDSLLSKYEATEAWEKSAVRDIAIRVTANVQVIVKSKDSGIVVQSEALPQDSLMSGEVAKRDALERPKEVIEYMEALIKEVKAKNPSELFLRDAENLIHGSVGLMKLQKAQLSLEAFKLGEQSLFTVFALQAKTGIWSLEDTPAMISTSRNDVLLTALSLQKLDSSLLPGVIIRWKCLYSEFRSLLMRFGLKNHYTETFLSIDSLRRSGKLESEGSTNLRSVLQQYTHDQQMVLEKMGTILMLHLSQQSLEMLQNVLEPDEAILEISIVATAPANMDRPDKYQVVGILMLLLPQGEPVVQIADFNEIFTLVKMWCDKLNEAILNNMGAKSEKAVKCQNEADDIGKKICSLIFPDPIRNILNKGAIDCLYICPDSPLTNLPLDILPWDNGLYLYQVCSISYFASAREALREWCIFYLESQEGRTEAVTSSDSAECLIFADPDYDMKVEKDESSMLSKGFWDLLKESLGISPDKSEKRRIKHLPKSLDEAKDVEGLLLQLDNGRLKPRILSGKSATLIQAIQVESPFLIHFSTHGFSNPKETNLYGGSIWTDMTMGIALAGINTYRFEEPCMVSPTAGTGELTAMAACGMNLKRTRLVYLSTCVSSIGFTTVGESVNSLAHAFRSAGAETVVGTLWPVVDEVARKFAVFFYDALRKKGCKPSKALVVARQKLREEGGYEHWFFWAPFICIGYNTPLVHE